MFQQLRAVTGHLHSFESLRGSGQFGVLSTSKPGVELTSEKFLGVDPLPRIGLLGRFGRDLRLVVYYLTTKFGESDFHYTMYRYLLIMYTDGGDHPIFGLEVKYTIKDRDRSISFGTRVLSVSSTSCLDSELV